jgi:hypothetical protein
VTLISVYNSEGCVGRCDARCYMAEGGHCDCICRGKNHGVGRNKAIDNTRENAEAWLKHAREILGPGIQAEIFPKPAQKTLFEN